MPTFVTVLALVLALPHSVGAVELLLGDLEAMLDLQPLAVAYTLDDGIVERRGDDGFDHGFGLSAGAIRAFPGSGSSVGPYLGGHATIQHYGLDDGDLTAVALRISGGLAWAMGDRWILAAGPVVEAGVGRMDLPATEGHAGFDGDGTIIGGGGELRARFDLGGAWALTGRAGYLVARHEYEDDALELHLDQDGVFIGAGISYRFANLPTALE